jgi:hypothetical protein
MEQLKQSLITTTANCDYFFVGVKLAGILYVWHQVQVIAVGGTREQRTTVQRSSKTRRWFEV